MTITYNTATRRLTIIATERNETEEIRDAAAKALYNDEALLLNAEDLDFTVIGSN